MNNQQQKSFLERAREIQEADKKATQEQSRARNLDAERQRRITEGGPAQADVSFDFIVAKIQEQIRQVGNPFALSSQPQVASPIEIVVRGKWLLGVRLTNNKIAINCYALAPEYSKPTMMVHRSYKVGLDQNQNWCWVSDGGSVGRTFEVVDSALGNSPAMQNNAQLVEHILALAVALAEYKGTVFM